MSLDIGDKAPDFTLPTDGNGKVSLRNSRGKPSSSIFIRKTIPPAAPHRLRISRWLPDFSKTGATVIGVPKTRSRPRQVQEEIRTPVHLGLRCRDGHLRTLRVWKQKSMYGRKYMGIERSTFLIDGNGVIRGVWHKVKVPATWRRC